MTPWLGLVIVHAALLTIALRRVWRSPTRWWPGAAVLVIASAAQVVFVGDGGRWLVLALVGTLVLALDTLVGHSTLVLALCTRADGASPPPEPEP
jgi:hypothetical protein